MSQPTSQARTGSQKPASQAKDKEPRRSPSAAGTPAPMLLDLAITSTQIVILLVGVIIAVVSYLSGAEVWLIVIRAAAAMLGLGLILWFANWYLAHYAYEYALSELKKQLEGTQEEARSDAVESTIERQA